MKLFLSSGESVFDRKNSHLKQDVVSLLPQALRQIKSQNRPFIQEEVDFGFNVGETICVPTGPGDQIVYAIRKGRQGHSRFVLNREPVSSSKIFVVLKRREEDRDYILITAFIGSQPRPEPWDRNATPDSLEFWQSHALLWGYDSIIRDTVTEVCPW